MDADRPAPPAGSTEPTDVHRRPGAGADGTGATDVFRAPPRPNPGAPYAPPGPPGPPQGWGPPPPGPPAAPAPRRRRTAVPVVAAVVVLAGAGIGAWLLLRPAHLDPKVVAAEVVRVTQATDELAATDVRCPDDVVQQRGGTFTCTATVVGKPLTYTVEQTDDHGAVTVRYERPVLDAAAVSAQVTSSTRGELGVDPQGVRCPGDVHYDRNATFTCTATLEGQALSYTVTQTDGVGGVSVAHGRVLKRAEVESKLAAKLTEEVGQAIRASCGDPGRTVFVNEPDTPLVCRAENAANPERNTTVTIVVNRSGEVLFLNS